MRSPAASDLRIVAGLLALGLAAAPVTAAADTKQECSDAYDHVQAHRRKGKLVAARAEAVICAREACPDFIKADCAKWIGEIIASTPTVNFEVHDPSGKETTAVRVDLDGRPWLDALDGESKPIDPGPHAFHYVLPSGESFDDTVQIREGEKNRKLTVSLQKGGSAPPPVPTEAPPAPAPADDKATPPSPSVAPWVIGGIGVAGLVVGGVLAGLVAKDKSTTNDPSNCNQTTLTCNATGLSAASQGRTLGPVSTVGFVVGGLGVGVSIVWLAARGSQSDRKEPPAAGVGMGPVVSASGATWALRGAW